MELYVHIPFCVRKCAYCAFDSYPGCGRPEMEKYVAALLREAEQRNCDTGEPIKTVYIGGGTPSLLPADLTEKLLSGLSRIFGLSSVTEFTVEANPGTVSGEWIRTVRRFGANRISFGVQAEQEYLLKTLGRIHHFDDARISVEEARKNGFGNVSVDLIFGIPGQTMDDWMRTLESAVSLSPEHISAYGLIPEEGTPLYHDLKNGVLSLPDPDLEREMYDRAIMFLSGAGFHQYEISNFARTGYRCRHNIGYWDQIPYLGLGLSAASMIRCLDTEPGIFSQRWTNPATFEDYYWMVDHPEENWDLMEKITDKEAAFETVMLSLRMTDGLKRERFRELHGEYPERRYGSILQRLEKQQLLRHEDDSWRLTRRGMDIMNSILLELMDA